MVGTLHMGVRPTRSTRYNTDLIFDLRLREGRGPEPGAGAGGTRTWTGAELGPGGLPYTARYQVHQVIGLTDETTKQEPNFFALATEVPARRIEFRAGKLTLPDFFDFNDIGSDSHLQFMNWTADNNGAWDYAADTRGTRLGAMIEYDDRSWRSDGGVFMMPVVANGLRWIGTRAE